MASDAAEAVALVANGAVTLAAIRGARCIRWFGAAWLEFLHAGHWDGKHGDAGRTTLYKLGDLLRRRGRDTRNSELDLRPSDGTATWEQNATRTHRG